MATVNNAVVEELVATRRQLGPVFMAKTGPINQLWIDDDHLASKIYAMEEASGRSQLSKPVFGGDFLFLVRDVNRARDIRSRQKSLLTERSSSLAVLKAVESCGMPGIVKGSFAGDGECSGDDECSSAVVSWPTREISSASFNALVTLYVGCQPLSSEDVGRLLTAVAGYRRRGVPNLIQALSRSLGISKKLSFTDEINYLLGEVVSRSGASAELLPLLVSATVGGAEIFPLLLQWCVLRLAVDKETQDRLHAMLDNPSGPSIPPLFIKVAAACARDCPVSAAIGPPRKITAPTMIEGYGEIPAESIAFAMHPGLRARDGGAPWEVGLKGGTWKLDLEGGLGGWMMFGEGPRACPAGEQSLNFLAAGIMVLVREFEWEPGGGVEERRRMFEIRGDGSLLVPKFETPLKFTVR
ncbi:hypothetical protein TrRE_jg12723 [Triparma retinervis]|uniref:Cytochrome P450 n=1 Tax=Triparma retinervis TaxID=2557542 RepID=A0A9W7E1N3_9STRA|nr:hypothetical protein TrRE_jg12723 [Triparma retinervis]